MLRYAFRRLLWTLPALVGVSLVTFLFLSFVPDPTDDAAVVRMTPPDELLALRRQRFLDLPRFVNFSPRDVRARASEAVVALATNSAGAEGARRELERLGGAALPTVVPELDALAPGPRVAVALALAPIARRMRLPFAEDAFDEKRAVAFWARYWEDRGIEFRRASVRSEVSRLLRYHAATTADDVRELDTFALSELFTAIDLPDDAGSLYRARTLVSLIADIVGSDDRIAPSDDLDAGRACVNRWLAWWNVYQADFVEFRGPSRVAAMLLQTRYGKWAFGAIAYRFGQCSTGAPVLDELRRRAPVTLAILFGAIALAYALAIPLGAVSVARRGQRVDFLLAFLGFGLYAAPTAAVAVLVARATGAAVGSMSAAIGILALGLVTAPARQHRSALATALGQDHVRAARARGVSRARALIVHALPTALLPVLTLAALEAPMALGGAFVVERVFGLAGIGELTIRAVQVRDTSWLMAISIVAAAFAALFVLFTDLGYVGLDRRLARGLFGRGHG